MAVLTLSGKCEVMPPYILRPTTRLAYWTGMRRCPRSTKIIAPTTNTLNTKINNATSGPNSPSRINCRVVVTADGRRATMPAKMIKEIPFPMPRSVICSPNHMINAVPEVKVITVMMRNPQPGLRTKL